jgi:hypothetical protein
VEESSIEYKQQACGTIGDLKTSLGQNNKPKYKCPETTLDNYKYTLELGRLSAI